MSDSGWDIFDIEQLKSQVPQGDVSYKEFLRVPAMQCGIYRLAKGSKDMQTPHDEDELYYVIEGKAQLRVGEEVTEVGPGSVMYIQATEAHSFFEIQEDMTLLVFFATNSH